MKQLTCEMCGSTNIIKQNGVYVCQDCGTKYSVEEARKMMVEGTVKIDNTDKLNNLYKIARQARDSDDSENAARYYDMIMQEDPDSWEATFYNTYYRAMQTNIINIPSAAQSVSNCLEVVFGLIKRCENDEALQEADVTEVVTRVYIIGSMLEAAARDWFNNSFNRVWKQYDDSVKDVYGYYSDYSKCVSEISTMLFQLGDTIMKYFPDDESLKELAISSWKEGMQYSVNQSMIITEKKGKKKFNAILDKHYGIKIRQYEPDYVLPLPEYAGFPKAWTDYLDNQEALDNIMHADEGSNDPLTSEINKGTTNNTTQASSYNNNSYNTIPTNSNTNNNGDEALGCGCLVVLLVFFFMFIGGCDAFI